MSLWSYYNIKAYFLLFFLLNTNGRDYQLHSVMYAHTFYGLSLIIHTTYKVSLYLYLICLYHHFFLFTPIFNIDDRFFQQPKFKV